MGAGREEVLPPPPPFSPPPPRAVGRHHAHCPLWPHLLLQLVLAERCHGAHCDDAALGASGCSAAKGSSHTLGGKGGRHVNTEEG